MRKRQWWHLKETSMNKNQFMEQFTIAMEPKNKYDFLNSYKYMRVN